MHAARQRWVRAIQLANRLCFADAKVIPLESAASRVRLADLTCARRTIRIQIVAGGAHVVVAAVGRANPLALLCAHRGTSVDVNAITDLVIRLCSSRKKPGASLEAFVFIVLARRPAIRKLQAIRGSIAVIKLRLALATPRAIPAGVAGVIVGVPQLVRRAKSAWNSALCDPRSAVPPRQRRAVLAGVHPPERLTSAAAKDVGPRGATLLAALPSTALSGTALPSAALAGTALTGAACALASLPGAATKRRAAIPARSVVRPARSAATATATAGARGLVPARTRGARPRPCACVASPGAALTCARARSALVSGACAARRRPCRAPRACAPLGAGFVRSEKIRTLGTRQKANDKERGQDGDQAWTVQGGRKVTTQLPPTEG